MESQDERQQDLEWLMRRAAELGHDPDRVARALSPRPPGPPEPPAGTTGDRDRQGAGRGRESRPTA